MVSSRFSSIVLILCPLFITISSGRSECRPPPKRSALFLFGDSYLDAGNNNYINTLTLDQANFWPYGESFFNYPTGRFSDGRLVSDFIAEYAKLPLIRPYLEPEREEKEYLKGVNFASAGAGALVETFKGEVISLKTQLKYYKKVEGRLRKEVGSVESKTMLSNAVYLFSIGSNDYMSPFLTNSTIFHSYSHSQYVGMVIGNLTVLIKEIYKRGGRKFGFLNLGPLGCLPGLRILKTSGCLEEASLLAKLHNEALSKFLSTMAMGKQYLEGFKYSLYDFNTNLRQIISHPSKYAEYAKLPLIQPYLQPDHNHEFAYGTNFASAGAGALVETFPGMVINLKTQLSYFENVEKQLSHKLGDNEAKKLLSNVVYLFSIGSNDYVNPFVSNSTFFHSYSHSEYVKMVMGNITTVVKRIYEKGGRKFGFMNLAPLGCLPLTKALVPGNTGNQCIEEITALVKLHNKALHKNLQNLERELKGGFKYSYFDLYTAVSERMENPSKYGFKEGGRACCGSGPFRGVNSCGGKRGIKEY